MRPRPFWIDRIEQSWKKAPIVWLSGVRRVGKTTLVKSFEGARFVNCDLPSHARLLEDPEAFLRSLKERVVIFDEIHQLPDPSRILKIAADEFPTLRVIATGSSTLAATNKFRDSLTGRKRSVQLLPVLAIELESFGVRDVTHRLLAGGLPDALLDPKPDPDRYSEWIDSYFARDVQELFRVEKRAGFLMMLETLFRNNGGLLNASSLGQACGLARATIANYLEVLETTHVIRVIRPFHDGGPRELVKQPRIYGFDTGFVAHARGWNELRPEDCGQLWENLVLEHLMAQPGQPEVRFWRDTELREIDFVIPHGRGVCDAIECKWDARRLDLKGLAAFRASHPKGRNVVVSPNVREAHTRMIGGFEITFTGLAPLEESSLRY